MIILFNIASAGGDKKPFNNPNGTDIYDEDHNDVRGIGRAVQGWIVMTPAHSLGVLLLLSPVVLLEKSFKSKLVMK